MFEGRPRRVALDLSSNGLTFDTEGRLIICEHGNRRISRGGGGRLPHGAGRQLRGQPPEQPQRRRLRLRQVALLHRSVVRPWRGSRSRRCASSTSNGIYRLRPDGELQLLVSDQTRPNGIALSPDESTLYVANSDENQKVWMAYDPRRGRGLQRPGPSTTSTTRRRPGPPTA